MILTILVAYAVVTVPLIGWAAWKAFKRRTEDKDPEFSNEAIKRLEDAIMEQLPPHQTVKIHKVPRNAQEAIMEHTTRVTDAVKDSSVTTMAWLREVMHKLEANKKDMAAMLAASEACTKAVLEMQKGESNPQVAIERFVHSLEYARDKFAANPTQRKGIDGVIINVKRTHAVE